MGVPLGIALGRALWDLFARQISVVPEPTVPALAVVIIVVGALVIANLVALLPGRRAGRTPAATLLRAELSRHRRAPTRDGARVPGWEIRFRSRRRSTRLSALGQLAVGQSVELVDHVDEVRGKCATHRGISGVGSSYSRRTR